LWCSTAMKPRARTHQRTSECVAGHGGAQAGFGWSDPEPEDQFNYNMQVRYALVYLDFAEGHLPLRTVYNVRRRLTNHVQQTGANLLDKVFEQVTDEQIAAWR